MFQQAIRSFLFSVERIPEITVFFCGGAVEAVDCPPVHAVCMCVKTHRLKVNIILLV